MRKLLTLTSLGIIWALAGCEQTTDTFDDGGLSNEPATTEPDVQIGRSDDIETGEPASAPIEREIEPNVITEDEPSGSASPQQSPQDTELQDSLDRPNREPQPLN